MGRIDINRVLSFLPDELFLKIKYYYHFKKRLDLDNPQTFNEKLQWLKLHDRKPIYTTMVDKIEAKKYVASIIGEEYIIPTLGVWNHFDEIDFDKLPNKFVLKCNHDCGSIIIVKEKDKLDKKAAKKKLEKSLKRNYYWSGREWPYKGVKPKIFAEQYLYDDGDALTDYKFFCFNGKPKMMYISKDHSNNPTTDFYDMSFKKLDIRMKDPNSNFNYAKPDTFNKMIEFSIKLANGSVRGGGIYHVRVDFYNVNKKLYFGEMTFYHMSGFSKIHPNDWDYTLGSWIKLPMEDEK